eukprot:3556084-Rhodomonas_salina.2
MGANASVLPGHAVSLLASALRTADGVSDVSGALSAVVEAPTIPWAPELTVRGPSDIGSCDAARFDVEVRSTRPLVYEWTCDSCSEGDALIARLALVSGGTHRIDGADLVPEVPYTIGVRGRTFLGATSQVTQRVLTARTGPTPMLTIVKPPGPYVRGNDMYLTSTAEFSSCATSEAPLEYAWTVTSHADQAVVLESHGAVLHIPKNTLAGGARYDVRLDGTSAGAAARASDSLSIQ